MSLDTVNPVFLNAILARLALLFLPVVHGDIAAACDAAREVLASYRPRTHDEMTIAADIIGNSFHSQDMLAQAADRELPPARVKSLLSAAVTLHKEAEKARRSLALAQRQPIPGLATEETAVVQAEPAAPLAEAEEPPATVSEPRPSPLHKAARPQAGCYGDEQAPAVGHAAYPQQQAPRYAAAASG